MQHFQIVRCITLRNMHNAKKPKQSRIVCAILLRKDLRFTISNCWINQRTREKLLRTVQLQPCQSSFVHDVTLL